jgi:hypothetical protein
MTNELDLLLDQIKELKQDKIKYEQKLDKLQDYHTQDKIKYEQKLDKLQDYHTQEISKYEQKLDKLQDYHTQDKIKYEQKLDKLQDYHTQEISKYEQKLDKLQDNHRQEISKLQDNHRQEISKLQDYHRQDKSNYEQKLDKLQDYHRQEIKTIRQENKLEMDEISRQADKKIISLDSDDSCTAISTLTSIRANKIKLNLDFNGQVNLIKDDILPHNSKYIKKVNTILRFDWEGNESSNNSAAINNFEYNLQRVGFALNGNNDFKIVDISNNKYFFECDFLGVATNLRGTADAAILPRDMIDNEPGQLRVLIEFKNTTTFDNNSSQIVGEVIASNYCSNHPSIVVKTDLNKNFDIYRIRKKTIYKAKLSLEEGFKAVAHWLSICSTSPTFDWKTDAHSFDEDLTYPLRFFYDEFKVRIINEFKCKLREHLEVIEMADSDLKPFDKFLSIRQFFQNNFNS